MFMYDSFILTITYTSEFRDHVFSLFISFVMFSKGLHTYLPSVIIDEMAIHRIPS